MLGVTTPNKTAGMLKKSKGILGIFTKTMTDLEVINSEMSTEHSALTVKQEEIQKDKDLLSGEISKNMNIVGKMKSFMDDSQ